MVSIVIPAYNEEAGIERTVKEIRAILQQCEVDHEIIVVDDGSRDGTYEKVRRMSEEGGNIRGIRFSRNFGKEAAILAGLQASTGEAMITIDADLQHPPQLIPAMIGKWRKGAKVVHAVKRDRSGDGSLLRIRASVFNRILSRFSGIEMQNASDFKLLDREAVDIVVFQMKEKRRFYRGLAQWVGFEQESLPFDVPARGAGQGKWSLRSLAELAITAIVSFSSAPLRIVTILGLFTLFFAFVVSVETLLSVYRGKAVSGFATIEITILLIGSFIMISLGIVGEYLAKIYEETKARPSYIMSSRCGFDEKTESPGITYPKSEIAGTK
jgi:glycosyltransferase involved in cell wall biosynthesis